MHQRHRLFLVLFYLGLLVIVGRLFHWQILMGEKLKAASEGQTLRRLENEGLRGQIFTSDGYLLVGNQEVYDLKLDRKNFQGDAAGLSRQLATLIITERAKDDETLQGSEPLQAAIDELAAELLSKFASQANWPKLVEKLPAASKTAIESLGNPYLHFDSNYARFYPEASMAAHLLGFVGRDEQAADIGRYGIEGALEDELKPKKQSQLVRMDALGFLLAGQKYDSLNLNGRDITLTIRRDIQYLAETALTEGMQRYQAARGEIIIMESQTGKILAAATAPSYKPWLYFRYDGDILKNPSLTRLYEPGSTFKTLTVAAGIDSGVITPETACTSCAGPRKVDKYFIKTWNDEYHPNISMTEGLAKSDNTAMIFISDLLGTDRLVSYLKKFGIGENIQIDLQDDTRTPFPKKIGPVETATISFGQGISTNSLEMLRAVNVIANRGRMLEPLIVQKVYDQQTQTEIMTDTKAGEQVISEAAAATVTSMMIEAAAHGEAQWIASDKYTVAAKTGTSQVPDPQGGYKADETIASFIGFAPASNPRFTMLVKLENPRSSPWAAETAAPLWYKVADKLMILLNITPDK